jgi:hypothetical protein
MLSLIKWFFERIDVLKLAEFQRTRNNRKIAARLHVALVIAYDIIEIYQVLLDELSAALKAHRKEDARHIFQLNLHRTENLLQQQSNNLEQLDHLFHDLYAEVHLLDPSFESTYRTMFSGKFGILWQAQTLLTSGRLPVHEDHQPPPALNEDLVYRTLWFSPEGPPKDRRREARYLHGDTGRERQVVDVHVRDGDAFFVELARYFESENPYARLAELRAAAERYKQALEANLSLSDVLVEIGSITRRDNWGKSS